MNPYREPGRVEAEPMDYFRLMQEAWLVMNERRKRYVGPKPPWYRLFECVAWEERWNAAYVEGVMRPSHADLIDAWLRLTRDGFELSAAALECIDALDRTNGGAPYGEWFGYEPRRAR